MNCPRAFELPEILPYSTEEDDKYLPSPGFVTDFVAALRGVETPTIFCIWSALWALSAASSRLIFTKWIPEMPLFPNLYVFLVAPPGRCHKSTAIKFAQKVLLGLENQYDDHGTAKEKFLQYMAKFNWATSKTTSDALYEMMMPQETLVIGTDKQLTVKKGSQLTICVSELATFLNKKKFNVGLIDTLTALFDCEERDVINTIARGPQELRDIFVTVIGATTPAGMKNSLPYETFGEGFMSRVTVVYKDKTTRTFPDPRVFDGFPTLSSLRSNLAWIMRHKLGEYTLSEDARDWYDKWYMGWRADLDEDEHYSERVAEFRFDVNLRRLSILLSMGRYDEERVVTKQDLMDAHSLLKGTYITTTDVTSEVGVGVNDFSSQYTRIVNYLKRHMGANRAKLSSNMSAYGIKMDLVRDIMKQLVTEGRVEVRGSKSGEVEWTKQETYYWIEQGPTLVKRKKVNYE